MTLFDFINAEDIKSIEKVKVDILENKEARVEKLIEKNISSGLSKEVATANAEAEIYKPEKLEKIKFGDVNKNFGKRIKISFFVNKNEYDIIKNKFKILYQFDENRISSVDINRFIETLIKDDS